MRHHNSVFHDLLKRVPWDVFDRLVSEHGADHRVRRLSTRDQLIAMLHGQLSGAASLREITGGLQSHRARLYHLGARAPRRSTLADANARRPSAVFAALFAHMAARAHRGLRRKIADTTYLIDASVIQVSGTGSEWAHFSHMLRGVKMHVIHDAHSDCPIHAVVTAANVNDITPARDMPIEPGATYVFDLGYYSYDWWGKLDDAGCRIVTRLKTNTKLRQTAELIVPKADADTILSDRVGLLPARGQRERNPLTDPVREVTVLTDTGKTLRVMSNDLDASAREIADLYKRRWAIELFFRWVKQTLAIRHCLGNSENAITIQIAVAMIAFLLLRLAHKDQNTIERPLAFVRLVRANLMHRRRIDRLLEQPPNLSINPKQLILIPVND